MNKDLATEITAIVTDKNEKQAFVQKSGITYKVLSDDEVSIGDTLTGFAYTNRQDQFVFTTTVPEIKQGTYGWGTVVKISHNLGVFVDIGWEDKDVVVSMDELPTEKRLWPKEGNQLFLTVSVDDKERIWGHLADEDRFLEDYQLGSKEMHNKDVSGITFSLKKSGTYAITDDKYVLFIHPSEREEEPKLGQKVEGRIIGLREDGVLYTSLKPRAHEVMEEDAMMLLEVLKRAEDHVIPFHNKTDPKLIKTQFGISKGQFKRAVGRLMKRGLVAQDEEGTKLVTLPDEE